MRVSMLRTSICVVTEEFSGCSRSTSILPLNFVNFPWVVPRNWCTENPIVDPDGSNWYASFAHAAGLKPAIPARGDLARCKSQSARQNRLQSVCADNYCEFRRTDFLPRPP